MPGQTHPVAARQLLHKGRKFDFEVLEYVGNTGQPVRQEIVRHPGAVVVLPVLDDGRVVLIQNYRPALGRAIYELPAGTLERAGSEQHKDSEQAGSPEDTEAPEACARRELIEETGYEAATVTALGRFHTSPGMSDEVIWAYVAAGLRHVGQQLEEGELLTVWPVSVDRVMEMVDTGELMDAKSILTILLARRRGVL